jgi:mannose-6-phosphate isomerase-like protein (cupin superfamily)
MATRFANVPTHTTNLKKLENTMNGSHHSLETLELQRSESGKSYLEFVRQPDISAGLYVLPVGGTDPQQPHSEDEVYVVLTGRAQIRVGQVDFPASAGDTIFVPAFLEHRFHSIEEELRVIVVFGPAEYSRKTT